MTDKEYVKLMYTNDKRTEEEERLCYEYNKELCKKYPFLLPTDAWTGESVCLDNEGNYTGEFSKLDELADGWRIKFGMELLEELSTELRRLDFFDKYRIDQIKEKYGGLRWYDNACLYNIIDKYEEMSYKTCIDCGEPAEYMSTGYICPYCKKCANKHFDHTKKYIGDIKFKDCYKKIKGV